jgi:hypothetical protein
MRSIPILCILLCAPLSTLGQDSPRPESGTPITTSLTGSLQGTLTGSDGAVIPGAKITANFTAPAKSLLPSLGPTITGGLQDSAVTASNGSFTLKNLVPGTYTLCAQAASAAQIDPCHWSQTPPQVTVLPGQAITGFKITTVKGSILNIRVDDPQHYLLAKSSVPGTPHVLVGVYTTSGQFYPAYITGKDATGTSYSVTIPLNTALRYTVASKHVKLADSTGKAVPANGLTNTFRHDSSVDNSAAVEFLITGAN